MTTEGTTLPPTPGGEGYESPPDKAMEQWHTDPEGAYTDPSTLEAGQGLPEAPAAPEGGSEYTREQLEEMTKDELQEMLEAQGLPTSGNKSELIDRLLEGA